MLIIILIGAGLVAVTVAIHAVGTTAWLRFMFTHFFDHEGRWIVHRTQAVLITTVIVLLTLHTIQIMLWALAYFALVSGEDLATFDAALYFSFVTFTTLGYGDITLAAPWRLLSGIQALNGIILLGWTTAYLFALVQRVWQSLRRADPSGGPSKQERTRQ